MADTSIPQLARDLVALGEQWPADTKRDEREYKAMTTDINMQDAQISTLTAHLRNILARIHRDGGQYVEQHGLDKAVGDADAKVAAVYAQNESLTTELAWVRAALDGLVRFEKLRLMIVEQQSDFNNPQLIAMITEYNRRKPLIWQAARTALAPTESSGRNLVEQNMELMRTMVRVEQSTEHDPPSFCTTSDGAASSSVDYQQQRGASADIVDEALIAYDYYMANDDYDAQTALDKIVARMRERRSLYLPQSLRPVWTNDAPKVAGWYWYRHNPQSKIFKIIRVSAGIDNRMVVDMDFPVDTYPPTCQWSGPIQPPGEKP